MNWKNRTVTYGGVMAVIYAGLTVNVPKWDEPLFFGLHTHFTDRINQNTGIAISAVREVRVRDGIRDSEFKVYMIEQLILQTMESSSLTENQKNSRIKHYEFKLEHHNKKLDRNIERLDEINSLWEGFGIAQIK